MPQQKVAKTVNSMIAQFEENVADTYLLCGRHSQQALDDGVAGRGQVGRRRTPKAHTPLEGAWVLGLLCNALALALALALVPALHRATTADTRTCVLSYGSCQCRLVGCLFTLLLRLTQAWVASQQFVALTLWWCKLHAELTEHIFCQSMTASSACPMGNGQCFEVASADQGSSGRQMSCSRQQC